MPSLREIQQRFAGDIAAGSTIAPTFVRTSGTSTGERMAVYCRTIRANYRNAMSATYPAVRRIVGTLSFNAAVDAYVDAHPSRCGDLNEYGDAFGDFLHGYAEAAELPYLRDVARLEWAIDEAHRAAEPALAPEAVLTALSHVAAGALPELHLGLEPSCRLVASAFPLLRIWQVNQADYDGDLRVDFTAGRLSAFRVDRLVLGRTVAQGSLSLPAGGAMTVNMSGATLDLAPRSSPMGPATVSCTPPMRTSGWMRGPVSR